MKNILKSVFIWVLVMLLLPVSALGDEMANDDFAAVSCGNSHTLALRNNGDLWAWGANEQGQIGNNGESDSIGGVGTICQAKPVMVLENVAAIGAGGWHSLALKEDGSLWGWGMNAMGQLGLEGDENVLVPVKLMEEVAQIEAGYDFSLVLKTDGTLLVLGNQEAIALQGMDQVKAMAAGFLHVLAVKEDGSLWAWGLNEQCQVGIGKTGEDYLYQEEPAQIFESGVVAVYAGNNHSLAIMEDGALWGWGDNSGQQLLDKADEIIAGPQLLLEGVRLSAAARGRTFAIKEDGTLWAWGDNIYKALNYNYQESEISATVRKIMDNVVDISSGGDHTMAVKQDGTLWAWGNNDFGQLGLGPETTNLRLPLRVKVEYPADVPEPEPEPEEEVVAEVAEEPPVPEDESPSPLPFIIGCGAIGAGGVTAGLVWRHKQKNSGVSKWRG